MPEDAHIQVAVILLKCRAPRTAIESKLRERGLEPEDAARLAEVATLIEISRKAASMVKRGRRPGEIETALIDAKLEPRSTGDVQRALIGAGMEPESARHVASQVIAEAQKRRAATGNDRAIDEDIGVIFS